MSHQLNKDSRVGKEDMKNFCYRSEWAGQPVIYWLKLHLSNLEMFLVGKRLIETINVKFNILINESFENITCLLNNSKCDD